jgi:hypothetical protein
MYPDSGNLSCLFHISRIKLVFSFCECRNVQFGLAKLNTFMDSESVKPLSARTKSPGIKLSRKPQFSVRNLSEVLPPQASLTKQIVPCGVIPINTLTVL